jgi:hypothetical protein
LKLYSKAAGADRKKAQRRGCKGSEKAAGEPRENAA